MLKNILGALVAVIAGMACVSISLVYSHKFFTAPEGLDPSDMEDRVRLAAAMTKEAKTIIVCGHMIGALSNVVMMKHAIGYSLILVGATLFAAYAGARTGSGNQVYIDK